MNSTTRGTRDCRPVAADARQYDLPWPLTVADALATHPDADIARGSITASVLTAWLADLRDLVGNSSHRAAAIRCLLVGRALRHQQSVLAADSFDKLRRGIGPDADLWMRGAVAIDDGTAGELPAESLEQPFADVLDSWSAPMAVVAGAAR